MVRLTAAQAMVRFLSRQFIEIDGREQRLVEGVFAIFGHGNVAGMGEALYGVREELPTYRAHNEQAMAHAAIAFAKASRRRRMMACTSSIGPGATNMVTAAAVAHVNRLPLLLIPGDVFASARARSRVAAGRGFRRRHRQRQRLLPPGVALFRPHHPPRADRAGAHARFCRADRPRRMRPRHARLLPGRADARPSTTPTASSRPRLHRIRRPTPDPAEVEEAAALLASAKRPLVVCGGGVLYSRGRERAARVLRKARPAGRRDPGRQIGACPTITRWRWAPSASPARQPPTRSRPRPT